MLNVAVSHCRKLFALYMAFGAHKTEAIGMLISGAGELLYTHKQTHTHICEGCVVEILIIIFLARLPLILIN